LILYALPLTNENMCRLGEERADVTSSVTVIDRFVPWILMATGPR